MAKAQTKAVNAPAPPPPKQTLTRSVERPVVSLDAGPGGGNAFVLWMASISDTFTPWGQNVWGRDRELRDFWPTESYLSGAVFTCATSNAAFEWELDGPDQTVEAVHDLLNQAGMGKGWRHFAVKVSTDIYTQDNGAFIEIIRERNSPSAPVIGIQHLDAMQCQRTGDLQFPVIYTDNVGTRHKMPWYSVIVLEEFPSPIESMHGVQYCAVTRVLRLASVLRDIEIYRGEKAGGRFSEAIHFVGGVKTKDIEDITKRMEEQADNQGLVRYLMPLILGSLDPGTSPSVATLELKSLPENFNFDEELRWYISGLALGFGRDYQDFAPLPAGNIGTSTQSEVLHLKSRGKGPAAFMRMLEQAFNFHGVMPRTVTFRFKETDIEAEKQEADVKLIRAEERAKRIESLEIDPIVARQIARDDGDLKEDYLAMMGERDVTPDTTVEGVEKPGEDGRVATVITGADGTNQKVLKSVFEGLLRSPEIVPGLKSLVDESVKKVALEDKVDQLALSVEKMDSETLQAGLYDMLDQSVLELAVATKTSVSEVAEVMRGLLEQTASEIQQSVDKTVGSLAEAGNRRSETVGLAVQSLHEALKDMERSQKGRKSAKQSASEMQAMIEDSTVIEQSVIKRDDEGRMKTVRKKFGSGRVQDFKVIRGRNGKIKKMKEIR